MRGKLFNVRGEASKRIMENKEIAEIKQILGIESGREYTAESAAEKLRWLKNGVELKEVPQTMIEPPARDPGSSRGSPAIGP